VGGKIDVTGIDAQADDTDEHDESNCEINNTYS
jgi:hypothetical protein